MLGSREKGGRGGRAGLIAIFVAYNTVLALIIRTANINYFHQFGIIRK